MFDFLKAGFGLRAKLIVTMMTLFIISSLVILLIAQNAQRKLVKEMEDNIDDLTEVIKFSVDKLTSEQGIDGDNLRKVIERLKRKGVNEISVLSEDSTIVASSNPNKIGSQAAASKGGDFRIKAELGPKKDVENVKEFNVPLVIGDENYGYINITMHLDSFTAIQRRNTYMRLLTTMLTFLAGTVVIIFLASKYTRPIHEIVEKTQRVSRGDLTPLPDTGDTSPEIRELVTNFNDMIIKLKEREDMEKRINEMEHLFQIGQLSSAIAHEIKNPLNFMNLAVNQVKDELVTLKDPEAASLVPIMTALEDEIKKLNSLLTNYLDYGRPLKLKLEYMDVAEAIENLIAFVRGKLDDLRIAVDVTKHGDTIILGDREKLSACFLNLTLNAMDAIKHDGRIGIDVRCDGAVVRIAFHDSGGGVAESVRDRIFEPYVSTKTTGMGLGLAFTKRIINEHGGEIWLEAGNGPGAEFDITLPRNL